MPTEDDRPRVLVVEDEPEVAALIDLNLRRDGWDVAVATNGLEALDHIREKRPDLLVTDLVMGPMDGFELIANLERFPDLAGVPVIVLTSKTDDNSVAFAHELGASVYLTKPFRPDELLALARRLVPTSG
jgi:DNA-binding response OmpR family regulator